MQEAEKSFLLLLKSHIRKLTLPVGFSFDSARVISLAQTHNVLPMIYDIGKCISEDIAKTKPLVLRLYGTQIKKNIQFQNLYQQLTNNGIDVLVVKGLVCASCYPNPDYRLSSDIDLIASVNDKTEIECFFTQNAFIKNDDIFHNPDNGLHIELTYDFDEDYEISYVVNNYFTDWRSNLYLCDRYVTLNPTYHFAYLIYHAFTHFIAGGCGIRQIIDIMLFAEKFIDEINFEKCISALNGKYMNFAYNVFYFAAKYFDCEVFDNLLVGKADILCLDDFADDLLDAGLFGKSTEDRLHSAVITESAVKNKSKFLTLFPPYDVMKNRYKILKLFPFLLPLFWVVRLFLYSFRLFAKKDVSPYKSIEIAENRIKLMRKMGIIGSDN